MKNDETLENVTRYADIEEYGKYNAGATMEDLKEYMDDGWIRELTPGTYNGALDKFDRVSKLTDRDIVDQVKAEMLEDEFIKETIAELYPELKTDDEKALEFTYIYDVFTIGERLYVDVD